VGERSVRDCVEGSERVRPRPVVMPGTDRGNEAAATQGGEQ
jgi:hypothetical protein